jgi:hypothetical protein
LNKVDLPTLGRPTIPALNMLDMPHKMISKPTTAVRRNNGAVAGIAARCLPQLSRCFRSPEQRNAESNGNGLSVHNLAETAAKEKRAPFLNGLNDLNNLNVLNAFKNQPGGNTRRRIYTNLAGTRAFGIRPRAGHSFNRHSTI